MNSTSSTKIIRIYSMQKINNFLTLVRVWSLPISIFSCLLPFVFGLCEKGNFLYGILATIGVILAHMASNLADDFFDYKKIVKEFGVNFDRDALGLQKDKCLLITLGIFTINQVGFLFLLLFFIAFLIGCYIALNVGFDVIYIAVAAFILSILYSKFTYCGLGEIAIGIIFCPLLYMGIFYSMTGHYSLPLLLVSIAVMPMLVGILFNHTMLDFDFDFNHQKVTICSMLGSRQRAWQMLRVMELLPYFLILLGHLYGYLSKWFLFVWLSLPYAMCVLYIIKHVLNKKPEDFLKYFKPPMKLFVYFSMLLMVARGFTMIFS